MGFRDGGALVHHRRVQSHELLRQAFQTTSAKQIAADLGLSLSLVYRWAEAPPAGETGGPANPVERMAQLLDSTKDRRLIDWLCNRAGGFFIQNPESRNRSPDYLIPATNLVVQEFADLLAVIAAAAADNTITHAEAQQIRRRWEALKSATEEFVAGCELGNFNRLKADARAGQSVPAGSASETVRGR